MTASWKFPVSNSKTPNSIDVTTPFPYKHRYYFVKAVITERGGEGRFRIFFEMVKSIKNFLQLLLKIINATIGIVGIAMIMYSMWMVRVWQRDLEDSSYDDLDYSLPWFIHVFLGFGIILCATSCLGHVAANTANSCCLSFYMITIFVLLLVETGLIADVFLNSDWVKDLPNDPSGRFNDFKNFIESNFETCKWISLLIILAQGCSVLLATVLKTLRTDISRSYNYMYHSDDEEHLAPRLTLLDHRHPLYYAAGDLPFSSENNTIKIFD